MSPTFGAISWPFSEAGVDERNRMPTPIGRESRPGQSFPAATANATRDGEGVDAGQCPPVSIMRATAARAETTAASPERVAVRCSMHAPQLRQTGVRASVAGVVMRCQAPELAAGRQAEGGQLHRGAVRGESRVGGRGQVHGPRLPAAGCDGVRHRGRPVGVEIPVTLTYADDRHFYAQVSEAGLEAAKGMSWQGPRAEAAHEAANTDFDAEMKRLTEEEKRDELVLRVSPLITPCGFFGRGFCVRHIEHSPDQGDPTHLPARIPQHAAMRLSAPHRGHPGL